MGHNNPDMDSIGSCMGIYRLAKTLDTNAYIVSSEDVPALKAFNRELDKDSEYEDVIINKEVAMENVDEDTLLVVVDTHKVNYVDAPELLKEVKKFVIVTIIGEVQIILKMLLLCSKKFMLLLLQN